MMLLSVSSAYAPVLSPNKYKKEFGEINIHNEKSYKKLLECFSKIHIEPESLYICTQVNDLWVVYRRHIEERFLAGRRDRFQILAQPVVGIEFGLNTLVHRDAGTGGMLQDDPEIDIALTGHKDRPGVAASVVAPGVDPFRSTTQPDDFYPALQVQSFFTGKKNRAGDVGARSDGQHPHWIVRRCAARRRKNRFTGFAFDRLRVKPLATGGNL